MLTVLIPAPSQALTTLAVVKAELRLADDADDAVLTRYIDVESRRIAGALGRAGAMARETVRETLRPMRPVEALILGRAPVAAIAGVTASGVALTTDDWEREGSLLYRLSGDRRICWAPGKVVVDYSAGWLLPGADGRDLPAELEAACLQLVKARWHARDRDPALRSFSAGTVIRAEFLTDTASSGGLPEDPWQSIEHHCKYTFG